MGNLDLSLPKGAIFSEDRKYRYALWRIWSQSRKPLLFIGLNPSKAGEHFDDPTVTRCMARAEHEGFGGLLVGNLYAYVSTNPKSLNRDFDAVGIKTDDYLKEMITLAGRVLCGWGAFPEALKRSAIVRKMLPEAYCLGITANGQPKHPLYISYRQPMAAWHEKEQRVYG